MYALLNRINIWYPIKCSIIINTDTLELNKYFALLKTYIQEYHNVNKAIKIEIYFENGISLKHTLEDSRKE